MKVSQKKLIILTKMWEVRKPVRSREVAEMAGVSVPSSTMHLIHLRKRGYVSSPERSLYAVTELGKAAIGLPTVSREQASAILRVVPPEKAFYFYAGVGDYTGVSSDSLEDFCEKIQTVDPRVIEFHISRGDFESWFHDLGDLELSKSMGIIDHTNLFGDDLRERVSAIVKLRCEELLHLSQDES